MNIFKAREGLKAQRLFLLSAPELFAPDRLPIGLGAKPLNNFLALRAISIAISIILLSIHTPLKTD